MRRTLALPGASLAALLLAATPSADGPGTLCFDTHLTAPDAPALGGGFGRAVAVSGNTAVVGAPDDATLANQAGAAYVYEKHGDDWVFTAKLVPPVGVQHIAGTSVAIDGDTIAVGVPGRMCCGGGVVFNEPGRVFVYERDPSGAWSLATGSGLVGSFAHAKDEFGYSVALSGERLAVGAPRTVEPSSGYATGLAYVFERGGGIWSPAPNGVLAPAVGELATSARFGEDVAIGRDVDDDGRGDRVAVGTPATGANGTVSVFDRESSGGGSGWIRQVDLVVSGLGPGSGLGKSVALSGEWVAAGSPVQWDGSCKETGAIWVFRELPGEGGSTWILEQKLLPGAWCSYAHFGAKLAMDGPRIAATADASWGDGKRVLLFHHDGSAWVEDHVAANGWAEDVALDGGLLVTRGCCDTVRAYHLASAASNEVVRLGTPANPNALLPGQTSGPIIGQTWDPKLDETVASSAVLAILAISSAPLNLPTPEGTILCSPLGPVLVRTASPGSAFQVPIPADCTLASVPLCAQGIAVDGALAFTYYNALDITIGTH